MHPMSQSKFVLLALSLLLVAACAAQPTHKDVEAKPDTTNVRRARCVTVPAVGVAGSYVRSMANTNYSNCTGNSDGAH